MAPVLEDPNPYFNVKDWGRSRGADFGFDSEAPVDTKYEPLFHVQVQCDPQYVLSVNKDNPRGPLVVLANKGKPVQIWKKVDYGNSFALVNKKTGFALQVDGEGKSLGTSRSKLRQNASPANLFQFGNHRGEGYVPIQCSDDSNLVISLSRETAANLVEVKCERWGKGNHQTWRLIPAGVVYTIRPKMDIAYGLSTEKGNARGQVVINEITNSIDHFATWYIEPLGGTEVKLINSASGFAAKRVGPREQIEQAEPSSEGRDHVWIIGEDTGAGFFPLHPATSPEESADVNGSEAHDGCKVRTVVYGQGDDQIWGFFPLHSDVPVDPLGRPPVTKTTAPAVEDDAGQSTGYGGMGETGYGGRTKPGYGGEAQPGYGAEAQPGYGGEVKPGYGFQPSYGGQSQPAYGGHSQPAYGGHSQPAYGGHSQPAYGGHSQPAYGGDSQPDYGGHSQPAYGGHSQPAYGGHSQPAYGGHSQPAYGGHSQPAYGGHSQPAYGGHSQPAYGGHSQPGYGGHTQSGYGGDSQSGYGGQSQPGYGDDSQSGYGGRRQSGYGDNSQPAYGGRMQPGSGDDSQPGYGRDSQSGYGGRRQSGYGDDSQHGYGRDSQSGYGGCRQSGYGDDSQPGDGGDSRYGYGGRKPPQGYSGYGSQYQDE